MVRLKPPLDGARGGRERVEGPDTTYDGSDGATIFVGAKSLAAAELTAASLGAGALKAGDGVVTSFTAAGKPAVAILGGDEAGLNAAALMFAGHLPFVWDQKGPAIDKIADDVKRF